MFALFDVTRKPVRLDWCHTLSPGFVIFQTTASLLMQVGTRTLGVSIDRMTSRSSNVDGDCGSRMVLPGTV
jgi:hypothetical protein